MEIQVHTLEEMWQWVQKPGYRELHDIPISPHRALSHYNNPRALKSDPVLWTAWNAGRMTGYRLVLPDSFMLDGQMERIAWLSCTWVHPEARGKRIAQQLLEAATEAWNNLLIGIDPSTPNVKVFERSIPYANISVEGRKWYLRSDLRNILPARNKRFRYLRGLLHLADGSINLIAPGRSMKPPAALELIKSFDEEAMAFIEAHNSGNIAQRSKSELDWVLGYPWLLPGPGPDWMKGKYYFSAFARNFSFQVVKAFEGDELKSVMLLSFRDGYMKVPYVWCDEHALSDCARLVYQLAKEHRSIAFTTYHPGLYRELDKLTERTLSKRKTFRHYVITKQLMERIGPSDGKLPLQDGDGDHIFI